MNRAIALANGENEFKLAADEKEDASRSPSPLIPEEAAEAEMARTPRFASSKAWSDVELTADREGVHTRSPSPLILEEGDEDERWMTPMFRSWSGFELADDLEILLSDVEEAVDSSAEQETANPSAAPPPVRESFHVLAEATHTDFHAVDHPSSHAK